MDDDWVVVLPGIEFTDGVIEFDALGQSDPPQSNFLGISFRYVDETTHDAVYFRPFNFRAGMQSGKPMRCSTSPIRNITGSTSAKTSRGNMSSPLLSLLRMGIPGSMPGSSSNGPN